MECCILAEQSFLMPQHPVLSQNTKDVKECVRSASVLIADIIGSLSIIYDWLDAQELTGLNFRTHCQNAWNFTARILTPAGHGSCKAATG